MTKRSFVIVSAAAIYATAAWANIETETRTEYVSGETARINEIMTERAYNSNVNAISNSLNSFIANFVDVPGGQVTELIATIPEDAGGLAGVSRDVAIVLNFIAEDNRTVDNATIRIGNSVHDFLTSAQVGEAVATATGLRGVGEQYADMYTNSLAR